LSATFLHNEPEGYTHTHTHTHTHKCFMNIYNTIQIDSIETEYSNNKHFKMSPTPVKTSH